MQTFVYVDSSILNSYVSQMYGGLVTRKREEALRNTREVDGKSSSTPDTDNECELKLPFLDVRTGITHTGLLSFNTLTETNGEKEFIEKVFHDNAIQELIDNWKESNGLNQDPASFKVGDYVLFTAKYDIFDMDFFDEIFNGKAFRDIMKYSKPKETGANREERRAKQNSEKQSDEEAKKFFNAVCKIVPCKKIIVTNDHIIPLDDRFLRESLRIINFKYGNEITILGKISNTPKEAVGGSGIIDPQISGVINTANWALLSILSPSAKWVVTPIALFFE